jgi:hypothetical protein
MSKGVYGQPETSGMGGDHEHDEFFFTPRSSVVGEDALEGPSESGSESSGTPERIRAVGCDQEEPTQMGRMPTWLERGRYLELGTGMVASRGGSIQRSIPSHDSVDASDDSVSDSSGTPRGSCSTANGH